ncbi:MAG: DEAD/DEAH box helicase family protein [Nitrososphaerota archaeon]|nr:DEAD/DEAH box helicase family protein [Nitrososphaerota archaeon]MDG6941840.1 DEAD/DEAH box helicase family protein [Nitrososphaerota archaeon]MDG6946987.1 DEAD/DEAH box helicase family protein [Nitrososphaerota archaeon]MDG6950601.1 DEAD/DEAH box helicase family protein [Nitrososphaerota archaeon]
MLPGGLEPRDYQKRIADVASKTNTLVVLPTGLGKTIIAMLVAERVLSSRPGSKVVVLAPTRPLVLQHLRSFSEGMKLPEGSMAALTGTVDPGEREVMWMRSRVIFATPQTVYNDVRHGRVSLKDVALAVFDEAHRSVRDYTYTKLAAAYKDAADAPLILGLTASPGASKDKVDEIKRSLFIEAIEARSDESDDVKGYVEKTAVEPIKVKVPDEYYDTILRLRELFNDKVKKLLGGGFLRSNRVSKKALLEARGTISARLKAAQAGGGQKGYIFGAIINQAQAVAILHAIEMIETQGPGTLLRYLDKMRERPDKGKAISSLLRDPAWEKVEEEAAKLKSFPHPKVSVMLSVVKTQLEKKHDSRVIVFTQYRDTIEDLVEALEEEGVSARRFVGQADREGSKGMDQRAQTEALDKFREGEFKVLVSSSIGEEGLHVPDVDLVVFYEAVPSEIRYIQRRGRTGRTTEGRVVILLAEGTVDESYYYSTLMKENRMKELVRQTGEKEPRRRARNPTLMDFLS